MSEADIRAVIYPYGQIASFHIVRSARCAFVEYVDREAAENAAAHLYNNLSVNGRALSVNWAKPRAQSDGASAAPAKPSFVMPPPPGMEKAPAAAYNLPGMPAPVTSWPPVAGGEGEQAAESAEGAEGSRKRPLEAGSAAPQNATSRPKYTPAPPPGPPPGPPPASAGLLTGLSAYGDDDSDEEPPAPAAASARGPAAKPGGGGGAAGKGGVQYPSMNPARMGAAV